MTRASDSGARSGLETKPLLAALRGEVMAPPPIWLMRQAGRYLPEYRALRAEAGSFMDLCLDPEGAAEVTMQPIRRFGFDAAILFSDILMIPHGLGQQVRFEEGQGPVLEALTGPLDLARLSLEGLEERLAPVYATLRLLQGRLPAATSLIGFAGAPWTVASYMIEGGSSRDYAQSRRWMATEPAGFARLIETLVEATARHLSGQVEAGAEALQIFDSWAGALEEPLRRRWCLEPTAEIVRRLRARHPAVPIILFPRLAGALYAEYAELPGVAALSLDSGMDRGWAKRTLRPRVALQGNLDPALLAKGGPALTRAVRGILEDFGDGPFVFNLGHGILPETPIEHVEALLAQVRSARP